MSDVEIPPAPDFASRQETHSAWEDERRAVLRLLPTLLASHRGQYVAIHKATVVAEGLDQIDVAKRAYARIGYVPVYVGLVIDEAPKPVRIRRLVGLIESSSARCLCSGF
jgi:hypothetical protein